MLELITATGTGTGKVEVTSLLVVGDTGLLWFRSGKRDMQQPATGTRFLYPVHLVYLHDALTLYLLLRHSFTCDIGDTHVQ